MYIKLSAVVTQAKLDQNIAERELKQAQKKLNIPASALIINEVEASCPGNILSLCCKHADGTTEVIDSIGRIGLRAERVADIAVKAAQRYLSSDAVVGEHLCDQLLLPMALGRGGRFTTLKPTLHTLTNIEVIQMFIDCKIEVIELAHDHFEIIIST